MNNSTITKTAFFAASRESVWAFLTEKDKLAKWFHPAEADLADGQDYALVGITDDGVTNKICWGKVLHMDRPSKLVWSFTVGALEGAMTEVTWVLEETTDGTRLTLVHEGLAEVGAAFGLIMALDAGWDEHLGSMRSAVKDQ